MTSAIALDPRPAVLPETSVFRIPDYLCPNYQRLILISHPRHLASLDVADHTTLIVSTDWMVWQRAVEMGAHCIHYEAMLDSWPEAWGDPRTHHQRVCEWVYDSGNVDMSLFGGVSLGKHFVRDVTVFANAWRRLWSSIDRAIEIWKPTSVVLVDARVEHDILDLDDKCALVKELADKHAIGFELKLDIPAKSDGGFSEREDGYGAVAPDPFWRRMLRGAYAGAVDGLFRLRWIMNGRPGTQFVYSNFSTINGLIVAHDPGVASPLFLAAPLPKSWSFLRMCWRKGVRLVRQNDIKLTQSEQDAVASIESRIGTAFAMRTNPFDQALGSFIQKRIIKTGWLRAVAAEVRGYRKFLVDNHVTRVVVGDITGHVRIIAECASVLGIPVDELPNGMFVVPQRNDARCGDKGRSPLLDRMLAWGDQNERWLKLCNAQIGISRTGYPALDAFRRNANGTPSNARRNALVLPVYVDADDVAALMSNIFTYLVDTLRVLKALGIENIRVKLHAGPQDLDYYRNVARVSGVDCDVVKGGPIGPHFEWADIVIGPVNSGAYIEACAAGLPYYGYRPWPSLIDAKLFDGMDILSTPADLADVLAADRVPDRVNILSRIASFDEITDSGRHVWQALTDRGSNSSMPSIPSKLQQPATQ